MGLTLDDFMAWKAEEMTMNTSSPCVAKSRNLVADFKKGIKQDPSLFPSLKLIDNWPTFKHETMAQAHLLKTLSTYLTQSTNHGAVRRKTYLHYSFTTSMQSSAPILRLTSNENWFGTMSHCKKGKGDLERVIQ
jgi:hypothetical protein